MATMNANNDDPIQLHRRIKELEATLAEVLKKDPERWFNTSRLVKHLEKVKRSTIYSWVRQDKLKPIQVNGEPVKVKRQLLFHVSDVKDFISRHYFPGFKG